MIIQFFVYRFVYPFLSSAASILYHIKKHFPVTYLRITFKLQLLALANFSWLIPSRKI